MSCTVDRRVFVKTGGLALVALGLDPLHLRSSHERCARHDGASRRENHEPKGVGSPFVHAHGSHDVTRETGI